MSDRTRAALIAVRHGLDWSIGSWRSAAGAGSGLEQALRCPSRLTILDGLETGDEDIFPDPTAQHIGTLYRQNPKALEEQTAAPA